MEKKLAVEATKRIACGRACQATLHQPGALAARLAVDTRARTFGGGKRAPYVAEAFDAVEVDVDVDLAC